MPRGDSTELAEVLPRGNKSVGGSKGVYPLGRRTRIHAPPEKGRQGASMELRRPSEGGKRNCFPSELTCLKLQSPALIQLGGILRKYSSPLP
jgi:hypothetical protein